MGKGSLQAWTPTPYNRGSFVFVEYRHVVYRARARQQADSAQRAESIQRHDRRSAALLPDARHVFVELASPRVPAHRENRLGQVPLLQRRVHAAALSTAVFSAISNEQLVMSNAERADDSAASFQGSLILCVFVANFSLLIAK